VQRRGIGAIPPGHGDDAARHRFAPQVVTDFGGRGPNVIGGIPGAKLGSVKPHAARRDVKKRCHNDAGVGGGAIDPFALRQPVDAIGHQPVVGPADELHHRGEIGRRRYRIEQPDGRKLRRDQAMGRPRRRCEDVRHRNTISVSS
jgi:hypothetical protein